MSTIYVIKIVTDMVDNEVLVTSSQYQAGKTYWEMVDAKARNSTNETVYYLSFKVDKDGARIEGTTEFVKIDY